MARRFTEHERQVHTITPNPRVDTVARTLRMVYPDIYESYVTNSQAFEEWHKR
jgi:hypothetical protein